MSLLSAGAMTLFQQTFNGPLPQTLHALEHLSATLVPARVGCASQFLEIGETSFTDRDKGQMNAATVAGTDIRRGCGVAKRQPTASQRAASFD